MRSNRVTFFSVCLGFFLCAPLSAQQGVTSSSQSSPQGISLLQKSLAVLVGNNTIADVTLCGSVRRIAGSEDESGTATIKALAGTGTRIDLSLPSGPRSEVRNISSSPQPIGSWSGPDSVSHAMSNHNLLIDPGWFPAFALSSLLSAPNAIITYIGPETRNGQSVTHVTAAQQFPALPGNTASLMQHLTQTDIFLDPNTNVPIAFAISTHPDNNAALDLPVEIDFSDYRAVNGSQVPFHVKKSLNNSLILDFQAQSVTLNSGLSASSFNAL